jgi:hypothetical protein
VNCASRGSVENTKASSGRTTAIGAQACAFPRIEFEQHSGKSSIPGDCATENAREIVTVLPVGQRHGSGADKHGRPSTHITETDTYGLWPGKAQEVRGDMFPKFLVEVFDHLLRQSVTHAAGGLVWFESRIIFEVAVQERAAPELPGFIY